MSVGNVGDCYDKALAETVIGLFKTEVVKHLGPWKTKGQLEWETMNSVRPARRASRPALDMPGQTRGIVGPQQMKDCNLEHPAAGRAATQSA